MSENMAFTHVLELELAKQRYSFETIKKAMASLPADVLANMTEAQAKVVAGEMGKHAFPGKYTGVDYASFSTAAQAKLVDFAAAESAREKALAQGATKTAADATQKLVEAKKAMDNEKSGGAKATQAQKDLVAKWQSENPDKAPTEIDKLSSGIASKALNDAALASLGFIGDVNDINAVRAVLQARMGSGEISYQAMVNIMQGGEAKKIAQEVMGRRNGYAVGSFTDYTDANGKTVSVRNGVDKALKDKLPGFADYNRTATRTIVDSSERFKGQVGFENIYGLFAYTLGVFDANKNPTPDNWTETDDAQMLWNSSSALAGDTAKNFIRKKMQDANRLPQRFLPDGTLNPAYASQWTPAIPISDTRPGAVQGVINQQLWDNPETLVDQNFWKINNDEWTAFKWAAAGVASSDKVKGSDIMRERMYEELKPKLDMYLAEFGEANSLAAIVAVHNADLGRKMARGLELTDEDLFNVNVVFGGVDPAEVGIVRDSLQRYVDKSKAAKGPTIIQPDRNKISEGFRELYQSMFHAEPSADELGQLVEDVAGKYISSQYSKTEFDAQAAATTALRGRDLYSQLYGNKPTGLSDENYNAQFVGTGQRMLGGMQTSSAALQAGMRSGDVNVTAAVTNVEQSASRDNSAWLENFYKSMQTASEMT